MTARPTRVALYSHDALGLGHVRRNLALAAAVRGAACDPDVLLVSGAPEATALRRPEGCDLITLPALHKDGDGHYEARNLSLELDELTVWRRELLTSALEHFAPDLLIVDRHPRGFRGELVPVLDRLPDTTVVLGLRDVLDDPRRTREEWEQEHCADALTRWYDEVWLYGDPDVHDPVAASGITVPVPVRSLGYLAADRPTEPVPPELDAESGPLVVGLVGGGADGGELARSFVCAPVPDGVHPVLVAGPQMPTDVRDEVTALAEAHGAQVLPFVADGAALLHRADAAVTMGGANTVAELLVTDTPGLIVPRVRPRDEQRLRAASLAATGHLDALHPDDATPTAIGAWIDQALRRGRHPRNGLRLDGLAQARARVDALVSPIHPPLRPLPTEPQSPTDRETDRVAV